jgi:hypothetical protein
VLESLAAEFPANPLLALLKAEAIESEAIASRLVADQSGAREQDLRRFHEMILAEARRRSGMEGVADYLGYLKRVWPESSLNQPPAQGVREGDVWRHPFLGLEMVRVEPPGKRPFWISKEPLQSFLAGSDMRDTSRSSVSSWRESFELAQRYDLTFPTVEQYRQAAGRVMPGGPFWAARHVGDRKLTQIWIDLTTSVTIRKIKEGKKSEKGDFLATVN